MSRAQSTPWQWCALAGLVTLAFYLWACRPLIANYFPTTDEIAIEAASTPIGGEIHASSWFTQGFQDYFRPYDEWGSRPSNFFRPLFNALFWVYDRLFGSHWGYQLAFGYLVHALVVSLTAYLAVAVFGLTRPLASVATVVAALNPALWALYPDTFAIPPLLQFPAYQTEIMCGALSLAAFLAFVRSRFMLFALASTLALFMKETALTLPLAALAMPGIWRGAQRGAALRNVLWLLLPLGAWLFVKLTVFQYGFSSFVMAAAKPLAWLTQPIRNLLLWPTGLYTSPLAQSLAALRADDWKVVSAHAFELAVNTAWWGAIVVAAVHALRRFGRAWWSRAPEPWVAGLVFAGGNLALCIALQESHLRYGYFWFALGPAAVFGCVHRRASVAVAAVLGLALALPQLWSCSRVLSADTVRNYIRVKSAARQLTGLLGALSPDVRRVYLIDDLVVQIPSPGYMAKFSGYHGTLLLVNSIRPTAHCTATATPPIAARYQLTTLDGATRLAYAAPACFEPYFGLPPLSLVGADNVVQRGAWLSYRYPQLSSAAPGATAPGATAPYDIGQSWSVSFHDPVCAMKGACVWIGFDERRNQYYALVDQPTG